MPMRCGCHAAWLFLNPKSEIRNPKSEIKTMDITIRQFQEFIRKQYYARDSERGTAGTFMWFVEEVGELSSALAGRDRHDKADEFADVLAWLCTLANINDVDLAKAVEKYTVRGVKGFK